MITEKKKKKKLTFFERANERFNGLSERECDIHIEIRHLNSTCILLQYIQQNIIL